MSQEHRLAGRIGGLTRWSRETDRSGATAKARQSFLARFENEADPEAARKLYFARLALKRFQTRSRKPSERAAPAEDQSLPGRAPSSQESLGVSSL